MSDETKSERWEHCGIKWRLGYCRKCGKLRPAPAPAMSEDERLAEKLDQAHDRAWLIGPGMKWDKAEPDDCECALDFLSRARELLEPDAEARGRRAAFEETMGHAEEMEESAMQDMHPMAAEMASYFCEWAENQRDACGPAKADAGRCEYYWGSHDKRCLLPAGHDGSCTYPLTGEDVQAFADGDANALNAEVERLKAQVQNGYSACQGVANLREQLAGMTEQRDDLRAKLDLQMHAAAESDRAVDDLRAKLAEAEKRDSKWDQVRNAAIEIGGRLGHDCAAEVLRILREQKARLAEVDANALKNALDNERVDAELREAKAEIAKLRGHLLSEMRDWKAQFEKACEERDEEAACSKVLRNREVMLNNENQRLTHKLEEAERGERETSAKVFEANRRIGDLTRELEEERRLNTSIAVDRNSQFSRAENAEWQAARARADLLKAGIRNNVLARELEEARNGAVHVGQSVELADGFGHWIESKIASVSFRGDYPHAAEVNVANEGKTWRRLPAQASAQPAPATVTTELEREVKALRLDILPSSVDPESCSVAEAVLSAADRDKSAAVKAAEEPLRERIEELESEIENWKGFDETQQRVNQAAFDEKDKRIAELEDSLRCKTEEHAVACATVTKLEGKCRELLDRMEGMKPAADHLAEVKDSRIADLEASLSSADGELEAVYAERDANSQAARELEELRSRAKRCGLTFNLKIGAPRDWGIINELLHLDQPAEKPETVTVHGVPVDKTELDKAFALEKYAKPGDGKVEG